MAKSVKYYQYTPKEIELYKKEKALRESKRVEGTNRALIALRKQNLMFTRADDKLRRKIEHFNKVIKSKPLPVVLKVVNYWMSDFVNE